MSMIMDNEQLMKQQAMNCIGQGLYPEPYTTYLTPKIYNRRVIAIEAVDGGGFIVTGHFDGKGDQKRVALTTEGLTLHLEEWGEQFVVRAK